MAEPVGIGVHDVEAAAHVDAAAERPFHRGGSLFDLLSAGMAGLGAQRGVVRDLVKPSPDGLPPTNGSGDASRKNSFPCR